MNALCKRPSVSLLLIHFKTIFFTRVLLPYHDQTSSFLLWLIAKRILIYSWQENRSVACSHTGPSLTLWQAFTFKLAGLRSVYILQRRDSEGSSEFGDTGGTPRIKTNRLVPGDHQEAVGAESTGDVSHIKPNERSHGVGVEGHCVSRFVLLHLRLQGNMHQHHNNQREDKCDAISNLEHRFLILYESFGDVAIAFSPN